MTNTVRRLNMLPELIRMACTMFGAWGPATPTGKLTQIRALDFGSGPFSNYTILGVYRSKESDTQAFATIIYPGMVGKYFILSNIFLVCLVLLFFFCKKQ